MIINTLQRRVLESAWRGCRARDFADALHVRFRVDADVDGRRRPRHRHRQAGRLAPAVIRALRNITGIAEGADGAGVARGVRLRRVLAVRVPQNRVTKL
jgi:hypothetical protein